MAEINHAQAEELLDMFADGKLIESVNNPETVPVPRLKPANPNSVFHAVSLPRPFQLIFAELGLN